MQSQYHISFKNTDHGKDIRIYICNQQEKASSIMYLYQLSVVGSSNLQFITKMFNGMRLENFWKQKQTRDVHSTFINWPKKRSSMWITLKCHTYHFHRNFWGLMNHICKLLLFKNNVKWHCNHQMFCEACSWLSRLHSNQHGQVSIQNGLEAVIWAIHSINYVAS